MAITASDDGTFPALRDDVADGIVVDHEVRSTSDEVRFDITARNPTSRRSEAYWAQACIRLVKFTGADQWTSLGKSFVFLDGERARMPMRNRGTQARCVPRQVWCPTLPRCSRGPDAIFLSTLFRSRCRRKPRVALKSPVSDRQPPRDPRIGHVFQPATPHCRCRRRRPPGSVEGEANAPPHDGRLGGEEHRVGQRPDLGRS